MLTCTKRLQWIKPYVLYFMLYSVFGWCYEVFLEVVVYRWGFSDRGVLIGPYCPIYGVGAMLFLFFFGRLMRAHGSRRFQRCKPVLIFLGSMAVATAVELAASYLLEWRIGSWPWQTYADYAWNFQARIALSPSIRFGIGGVWFLYVVQPLFEWLVRRLSPRALNACVYTVSAIMCADVAVTVVMHIAG